MSQLSGMQRFVRRLVSPERFARMEEQSRTWTVNCSHCGHARSVWDMGGIRYQAAGNPRRLHTCPSCGRRGWHVVARGAGGAGA